MDQFAVTHGVADHALLFDCRSLEHRVVPLAAGVRLVICNTMVRHSHASGGYNVRRAECDEILVRLQARDPSIGTLRDISVEELDRVSADLPDLLRRRLRHVVSENERVALTAAALAGGDLDTVGRQLAASHDSLRDDYEVSTPELDLMVELARGKPGVTGARMTGGGFGGCTINLVGEADAEGFASEIRGEFGARTGVRPQIFICSASDGVRRVDS
jgi:galactokinase